MRTFLRVLIYIPLALVFLFFAEANRGPVKISLDPFPGGELGGPSFEAPLFLVVLASMALGVVLGGLTSWLRHRPVRRAAREARAEARKAAGEVEQLRQQALSPVADGDERGRRR